MLIKLGDVWVDPRRIEALHVDPVGQTLCITTDTRASYTTVVTASVDAFAELVNAALNQQSYPDEVPSLT